MRWCYGRGQLEWDTNGARALGHRTRVMGIVNVTPDSFSDGGAFMDLDTAVRHGMRLVAEGADILDIGGESTRPGADSVSLDGELNRVIPVISALRKHTAVPISIDTTKAEVARRALESGADIINDVSALTMDPEMINVARESQCGVVLMHMRGRPQTMQTGDLSSDDIVQEVTDYLAQRVDSLVESGVDRSRVCVDPGIGFGKTVAQNLELHGAVARLAALGTPVLMGTSRKSFIGKVTERDTEDRAFGTASSVAVSAFLGAHLVRVHDVREMVDVVRISDAIRSATSC